MKDYRILTIPNLISVFRIIISLTLIMAASSLDVFLLRVLVAIIFLSDFLDGFLARKLNSVSRFGAMLDPFADRLAVVTVSISLNIIGRLPLAVLVLLLLREAVVIIGFFIIKKFMGKELKVLPEGKTIAALVYALLFSVLFLKKTYGFYVAWFASVLYYCSFYFYIKSIYGDKNP